MVAQKGKERRVCVRRRVDKIALAALARIFFFSPLPSFFPLLVRIASSREQGAKEN